MNDFMNKITKIVIVLILILTVGVVIVLKEDQKTDSEAGVVNNPAEEVAATEMQAVDADKDKEVKALPRLVDLGAGRCVPCKRMAPVLEEVKKEYAGVFDVEFIDVLENPDAGKKYNIRMIPTQIFFDAAGKELFRHEGFFSKENILAKWNQLGIDIKKRPE